MRLPVLDWHSWSAPPGSGLSRAGCEALALTEHPHAELLQGAGNGSLEMAQRHQRTPPDSDFYLLFSILRSDLSVPAQ